MHTTIDDLTTGDRLDIVVEFISARTYRCGETRLSRLLVADRDGTRLSVLGIAARATVQDLRTGETYRLTGLLGATSPTLAPTDESCPDCDGPLRPGGTVDVIDRAIAQTAIQRDVGDRFGIMDTHTLVRPHTEGPAPEPGSGQLDRRVASPPDFVCRACACHVWQTDLGQLAVSEPIHWERLPSLVEGECR